MKTFFEEAFDEDFEKCFKYKDDKRNKIEFDFERF